MSPPWECLVRGGQVVTPQGVRRADLGLVGGRIAKMAPGLTGKADHTVDATGKYIFPGIIDAHVHFNEPGRTDWEGFETGSLACAAGGGTSFFDMPLNSEPPAVDAEAFAEKRRLGELRSCLDFGLWGGLIPGNLGKLGELRDAGAVGLKAFMSESGIPSFPRVDAGVLKAGMSRAAEIGLLVAVHAEDEAVLAKAAEAAPRKSGPRSVRAFLDSRPVEAETAAIRIAIELAGETRCRLHIVHVSSPEGLDLIAQARRAGVDVTAETCPHYLLFNDADMERIGAPAKCAPPLRDEGRRQELWKRLAAGQVETVGSDHSPAPPELKESADFFAIWGGIAGIQHGAGLLLAQSQSAQDWPRLAAALSRNVAQRFGLSARKGLLAEGYDADFSVVAIGSERTIAADELVTRHRLSPYLGRRTRVQFTHTFVRGQPAWIEGRPARRLPKGRFLQPRA